MMHTIRVRYRFAFSGLAFFCGLATFLYGFLLNRSELHYVSEPISAVPHGLQTQHRNLSHGRVIFLLADGLSYTFVRTESDVLGNASRFQMPFVTRMLSAQSSERARLRLFHFTADPPTTTLQRLKALMTGSMPTFVDAGSNFGSSELLEDNLILQWNRAGRRILFVGDDTWMGLFPSGFAESHPHPSFNVRDLDTVDRAVQDYVLSQLSDSAASWDVLIGHLLGVDHCGHTYGPNHPEMSRKLRELDQLIRHIVERLRTDDLLIVAGDHGMTPSGDHGGDSLLELDAALLVYRPQGFVRHARPADRLAQIDLVPTLAFLTGVPVPYSNLGVLVRDLMPSSEAFRAAIVDNFVQLINYTVQYHQEIGEFPLPNEHGLASLIRQFRGRDRADLIRRLAQPGELDPDQMQSVLRTLQSAYREHWTRFDLSRMGLGASLMLSSLLLYFTPLMTIISLLIVIGQLLAVVLASSRNWEWPVPSHWVTLAAACGSVLIATNSVVAHRKSVLSQPSIGLIVLLALSYTSNSFLVNEVRVTLFLMQTLVLGHCLRHLIRNLDVWASRASWMPVATELFGLSVLLRLSPLFEVCREESYVGSVCRPQTDPWLVKPLGKLTLDEAYSLASFRLVTSVLVLIVALVKLRRWLRQAGLFTTWNGTRLAAQIVPPIGAVLVTSCWILDVAQVALPESKVALISVFSLHLIRVWCARVLLFLLALMAALLLYRPLLTDWQRSVLVGPRQAKATSGTWRAEALASLDRIKPVYTGWLLTTLVQLPVLALLLFLNEVHVVSLLLMPLAIVLYQSSAVSKFEQSLRDRGSSAACTDPVSDYLRHVSAWHVAVFLCFLDNLSFYLTGHQPTVAGIPWDAAFAAYAGDHTTQWLPALMVLVHLFAGSLLVAFCVPLCVTGPLAWWFYLRRDAGDWRRRSHVAELMFCACEPNDKHFVRALGRLCSRFFFTKATLTFGCVLSAGLLRRHLMVWKIFTPRLVFSVVSLIITGSALVLTYSVVVLCLHRAAVRYHAGAPATTKPSASRTGLVHGTST